jgi:hypothetical protein
MPLHYRERGDIWHCRGSVRVGRNTFPVREFSTECTSKIRAEAVGAAKEAEFLTPTRHLVAPCSACCLVCPIACQMIALDPVPPGRDP